MTDEMKEMVRRHKERTNYDNLTLEDRLEANKKFIKSMRGLGNGAISSKSLLDQLYKLRRGD